MQRFTAMPSLKNIPAALLVLLALSAARLHAQDAPDPDAPPTSNAPSLPANPKPTFSTTTTRVDLFFTVRDSHGALLPGLKNGDCSVTEEKIPQIIKTFEAQNDLPLTLGMLVDTSGSMDRSLPAEKEAGTQFFRAVLQPQDQAFLLTFDVNIDLLADFSSNPRDLARALNNAKINTGGGSAGTPGIGQGPIPTSRPKGTVLFDAVYVASKEKLSVGSGRKALILITDGQDEGSDEKLNDAIEAAQKSNVIVYVLWVYDHGLSLGASLDWVGDRDIQRLARETGGRVLSVGTSASKMEDAFTQIEAELRTQYLLTYAPTNTAMDGKFRNIAVVCSSEGKPLKVQTRKGYYALSLTDQTNPAP
jgi:VWFA-related protein